jgi:uncharacterized protein YukE
MSPLVGDPQDMRDDARLVSTASRLLTDLATVAAAVQGAWRGAAADAFQLEMRGRLRLGGDLAAVLAEMSSALERHASEVEGAAADRRRAQQVLDEERAAWRA